MFNLSGSEIVVILLLALVVLGPEKLPDAIRRAGRTYAELKKMGNSFQSEMRSVLDEPMREMRDTADLLKKSVDFADGDAPAAPTVGRPAPPRVPTAPKEAPVTAGAPAAEPPASEPQAAAEPTATDPQPAVHPPDPAPARSGEDALIDRTLSGES